MQTARAYPKRAVANDRNGLWIQPLGATASLWREGTASV